MNNEFTNPELVLVFKTNLTCTNDVKRITPFLNSIDGIKQWNVDLSDIDNVLRIESSPIDAYKIKKIVAAAGFSCEELQD